MTRGAQTRKARTEALLQREGIPFLPSLPCIESAQAIRLRSANETGIRIACLFGAVGSAYDPGHSVYKDYLRSNDLWEHLTPNECDFLSNDTPDEKSLVNFTWRCESIFLLMWATRLFDDLSLPRHETDPGDIVARFPAVDCSPWPFIRGLRLRKKSELLDASDLLYRVHWATRQARCENQPPPGGLNSGAVQEWHHAINWLTRYGDCEWDDVPTDT